MSTVQCALFCKHGAKYGAHPPVYAIWTVVPDIYNIFTAPIFRIQNSIKRSSAAIGDMSTIQRAIYCKLGASANTAYNLQFTHCEMWSLTYTIYLQLHLCRIQNSAERISAVIGDISTIQCALYSKHGAKYRTHSPVSLSELWSRPYTV
jgi:hypothetical protein